MIEEILKRTYRKANTGPKEYAGIDMYAEVNQNHLSGRSLTESLSERKGRPKNQQKD